MLIDGSGSAFATGGTDVFTRVHNGPTQPIDAALWNKAMHAIVAVEKKLCPSGGGSCTVGQVVPGTLLNVADFASPYPNKRWLRLAIVTASVVLPVAATEATVNLTLNLPWGSGVNHLAYPLDGRISVKTSAFNAYGVTAFYKTGTATAYPAQYCYTFTMGIRPTANYNYGTAQSGPQLAAGTYYLSMLMHVIQV